MQCSDLTYRDVFSTPSNIFDGTFCKNSYIIDLIAGTKYSKVD